VVGEVEVTVARQWGEAATVAVEGLGVAVVVMDHQVVSRLEEGKFLPIWL
jgi:hypothetical protein